MLGSRSAIQFYITKIEHEALEHLEWRDVMLEGMKALGWCWEIMELPTEKTLIGFEWTFTVK